MSLSIKLFYKNKKRAQASTLAVENMFKKHKVINIKREKQYFKIAFYQRTGIAANQ